MQKIISGDKPKEEVKTAVPSSIWSDGKLIFITLSSVNLIMVKEDGSGCNVFLSGDTNPVQLSNGYTKDFIASYIAYHGGIG